MFLKVSPRVALTKALTLLVLLSLLAASQAVFAPLAPSASLVSTNNTNHLYFYWKNAAYNRCGDVDSAPRMPEFLFQPQNSVALKAYINVTIALYHIKDGNPSDPGRTQLRQGTCKENGFGTLLPGCPSRKPNCAYPNPKPNVEWAPKKMMSAICDSACNCNYPNCPDVPDDPKNMHWCSLCGPRYNAPINVTLYNPNPILGKL